MQDLAKLKETLASLDKKFEEIKGQISSTQDPKASPETNDNHKTYMDYLGNIAANLHSSLSALRNHVYSMADDMYAAHRDLHKKIDEHLEAAPSPKTATQTQAYLEACKMGNDYDVKKPALYAKASRRGLQFEATLDLKKR